MNRRKGNRQGMIPEGATSIRASISFPPDMYEMLEQLARKKKVSLAWVVRDAVERYVADHEERLDQQ
jgi:predicted DNA-binding protein